jgi:hypothetical protein
MIPGPGRIEDPLPDPIEESTLATKHIYTGRISAAFLLPLGLGMLCLAAALPFVLESPLVGFVLMGLPMIAVGFVALLHGFAAAFTRIEITGDKLKLAGPAWRGFPVPPLRRATVGWSDVLAVRHRIEIYRVPILPFVAAMPFLVDVYAIDTSRERFILGGRSVPRLSGAVAEIAARSGCSVQSEPEVRAKLIGTLLRGAPPWRHPAPREQTEPAGNP